MEELPVPSDLSFMAVAWAIELLGPRKDGERYRLTINKDDSEIAFELCSKLGMDVRVSEVYDRDEWSLSVVGEIEVKGIHSKAS